MLQPEVWTANPTIYNHQHIAHGRSISRDTLEVISLLLDHVHGGAFHLKVKGDYNRALKTYTSGMLCNAIASAKFRPTRRP